MDLLPLETNILPLDGNHESAVESATAITMPLFIRKSNNEIIKGTVTCYPNFGDEMVVMDDGFFSDICYKHNGHKIPPYHRGDRRTHTTTVKFRKSHVVSLTIFEGDTKITVSMAPLECLMINGVLTVTNVWDSYLKGWSVTSPIVPGSNPIVLCDRLEDAPEYRWRVAEDTDEYDLAKNW
jgi:hypothetical protein